MSKVIDYINQAGVVLSAVISITPEIEQLVSSLQAIISGSDPTDADWDALHKVQDANTAVLNAPMEGENSDGGSSG